MVYLKCLEYHWPQYSHYLVDPLVVAADFGSTCHPQTEVLRCSSCYQINPEQNHHPKEGEKNKRREFGQRPRLKNERLPFTCQNCTNTHIRTHRNLTTKQISAFDFQEKNMYFNNRKVFGWILFQKWCDF